MTETDSGTAGTDPETLRALVQRLETLAAENAGRAERMMDLTLENGRLKRDLDRRFSEIARMTRRLSVAETALAEAEAAVAKEIRLREKAEAYAEAVTSSSVWRVTAPVRRIVGRMLGRPLDGGAP